MNASDTTSNLGKRVMLRAAPRNASRGASGLAALNEGGKGSRSCATRAGSRAALAATSYLPVIYARNEGQKRGREVWDAARRARAGLQPCEASAPQLAVKMGNIRQIHMNRSLQEGAEVPSKPGVGRSNVLTLPRLRPLSGTSLETCTVEHKCSYSGIASVQALFERPAYTARAEPGFSSRKALS